MECAAGERAASRAAPSPALELRVLSTMAALTKEQRIGELRTAWAAVEATGLLTDPRFKHLREDVDVIRKALDDAARDDLDVGDLTGAEISARRVMEMLWDATKDPKLGPEQRPWGGDIDAATAARRAAAAVDATVKVPETIARDVAQGARNAAAEIATAAKEAAKEAAAKAAREAATDAVNKAARDALPLVKVGLGVALVAVIVIALVKA